MKKKNKRKKGREPKNLRGKDRRSSFVSYFEKAFFKSNLFYLLLFVFVLGLAILLRVLFLSSDPPHVSWSQDLTTDAPAYTSFARSTILWGEWNPFGQYRFVLWLNSAFTLASFLFFKLLGVGRFQANLVSVFFNIFTILFIYLAVKKALNKNTALLSSFFLGINYILLMYSRSTFSEISTLFFIALGLYFFVLGFEKNFFLILSGASHAGAILFGKMLATFILPVCSGVLILLAIEDFSKKRKKIKLLPTVFFLIGFFGVFLSWYLIVYASVPADVKFFLKEVSVGLYGAPIAFNSIKDFIYSLYSFGYTSGVFTGTSYRPGTDLFYRMPFIFLLSCLFLLFYFFNIFKGKFFEKIKSTSKLEFYLAFWAIVGFLALMLWNYRPLRYQLLIIPPFCILAGIALNKFLNPLSFEKKEKLSWAYGVFFLPICSILTFHLFTFFLKFFGGKGSFDILVKLSILSAIVLIIILLIFFKKKPILKIRAFKFKLVGVSIIVFLIFFININQYLNWAKNPQYSLNRSSQDLGKILNRGAVLSGPYAPPLTLDNDLGLVLHMFSVVKVDSLLFKRYPITHLALESRGGNKERAFRDYPEIMNKAKVVTTYVLRRMSVTIFRISETTGNPQAESYQLSDFEKAQLLIEEGKFDSAMVMLHQFVSEHPRNFSGYKTLAEIYYDRKDFEKAALFLKKASKFDPTNFLTHQFLGAVYLNLYNQKRDDNYRLLAIAEWEKALKLFPQNANLSAQLKNIRGY